MSNTPPTNSTLTLALMAGLPGVGKSTLARKLKKKHGWQVIDKDELKEMFLRDKLDDHTASYQAYELSFQAVRKTLQSNQSVILDTAALHPFILNEAQEIISSMKEDKNVRVRLKVLFLIVADRNQRIERIKRRPPQTTVIRVDPDPQTVEGYLECYTHLPLPPGSYYLDTSKRDVEDYVDEANYYLVSDDEVYPDDEKRLKGSSSTDLVLSESR